MVGIDPNGIMPDPSNRRMRIDPSVLNNPIADRRMRASSPLAEDAGGPVILAGDESGLVNAMEAFLRGLFTADGHVSINGDIEPNSTRNTSNAEPEPPHAEAMENHMAPIGRRYSSVSQMLAGMNGVPDDMAPIGTRFSRESYISELFTALLDEVAQVVPILEAHGPALRCWRRLVGLINPIFEELRQAEMQLQQNDQALGVIWSCLEGHTGISTNPKVQAIVDRISSRPRHEELIAEVRKELRDEKVKREAYRQLVVDLDTVLKGYTLPDPLRSARTAILQKMAVLDQQQPSVPEDEEI